MGTNFVYWILPAWGGTGWARVTVTTAPKGSPRGCEPSKEPEPSQGHVNVKPGKSSDSSISHQKEKNQFCIKSSLFMLVVKQKNLITSLHITKGLFWPVDFGKSGHWELLNETTVGEKRKDSNRKIKRKGDKELIMTHSVSGQESKRRQITPRSGKSREEINKIYHGA